MLEHVSRRAAEQPANAFRSSVNTGKTTSIYQEQEQRCQRAHGYEQFRKKLHLPQVSPNAGGAAGGASSSGAGPLLWSLGEQERTSFGPTALLFPSTSNRT